ncbi:MAG: hypothetical protein WCG66_09385 [bacterium]
MITKILHILETSLTRIRPQIETRSHFAWQSEFLFIKEKSKPAYAGLRSLAQRHSIYPANSRPKGNRPA